MLMSLAFVGSVTWSLLAYGVLGLVLLWQAGRLLHRLWWQPRRLELALHAQGLRGTRYRFLTGDLGEHGRLNRRPGRGRCRCGDTTSRRSSTTPEHDSACFTWFGPTPKMTITDPDLAKDVLSNKFSHFEKPKFPTLTKLFSDSLTNHEGEKWVKHRRILNPAFHLEKLKVDVWPEMQILTGDVISRTAFGSSYLEARRIFQLQAEQTERLLKCVQKLSLPTKNNRKMHQIKKETDSIARPSIAATFRVIVSGQRPASAPAVGAVIPIPPAPLSSRDGAYFICVDLYALTPPMVLGAGLMSLASLGSVPWSLLAYGLLGLVLMWQAGRLLHRLWRRPRRLELVLRAQGLRGTRYRFLTGDLGEHGRLNREAWARPLPLRCHDIAPRVAPFLHNTVREHGKACFSWFGPIPKVTITNPDLAKDVLSNKFGHFEKPKFQGLTKLLSDGVGNHEGEKWVKHRRILNPAFHLEKLKRMLPAFSTCCEELISRWMVSLGSDGSYEVDVWPEMQSLTGDVISRTAFGSSYLEGRRIFQLQAEQAERLLKCIQKIIIPGYMSLPTKNNRKMHQIKKEIDSILRGLIGKRMQAIKEGESTKDDLLGLLLESNMRHTVENGQSSQGLTIEEVIEECKLFYFAGMETTSVLLTWTMLLLSMHPEWQDRAREEILGQFGKNKPEYEGLSRLKIVTMILYEVLRLYPPAVTLIRQTYKQIEIGGVTYPAGVIIELPVLLIHSNPDIWGSDVHEFNPERFAEGISKASKDPGAFLPFGWGPRICIGQNFALLEAKMALCMILQRLELELAPSYTHAPQSIVTLRPMHGAQIKLRAIR
uniref:Cytochrome P450 n=1 Tax=Oryza punctata TaxID=4537 RepID=A0A0E0JLF3_ORYPU